MSRSIETNHIIRKTLKAQIYNKENNFIGHNAEYDNLHELVTRTVQHGESNSVLLIGAPGSGKSTLVNNVLQKFDHTHLKNNATVVQLNGLVHTDDKLAIRSITTQLCVENEVGDQVFGSFAENLSFVLQCFKRGENKSSKSLIFILDEFELFCAHHNQTLLYNLFDVAQSGQAPLCIIGLTCNTSVVELLEKRVRSRFSHRKIWLFPKNEDCHRTFLTLKDSGPLSELEKNQWNTYIQKELKLKNVQEAFKLHYNFSENKNELQNILIRFVSKIDANKPWPDGNLLITLLESFYKNNPKINLLCDLTVLEISLIIAMQHHSDIYDGQPFNFKMIYDRFRKFAVNTGIQAESRSVVMKAFQHIIQLELIAPIIVSHLQTEHQMYKLCLMPDEITEAIKIYPEIPTAVSQWAMSSIH